MDQIRTHSAVCAHLSRLVAANRRVPAESALLCWLLHDVGMAATLLVLADQINTAAPNIPNSVGDELQAMKGTIDAASASLGGLGVPSGFQESAGMMGSSASAARSLDA